MAWHHNNLTVAAAGPPFAAGPVSAYVFGAQGTQHVSYRIGDRPSSYVFASRGTQHLVYRGNDRHVHELRWDAAGRWHRNDLTVASGVPSLCMSNPVGYVFAGKGTRHVVYRADDGHIWELWWNVNGWHFNDLTKASRAPDNAVGELTAYAWEAQGTQHVVYAGADGHVQALWLGGEIWQLSDLTRESGATVVVAGTPVGTIFAAGDTEHVAYLGSDGHVHELSETKRGWLDVDVTLAAGNPPLPVGQPTAYSWNGRRTRHIDYRDAKGHIQELWWDGAGWHANDLTAAVTNPPSGQGMAMLAADDPKGYVFEEQGTQHVIFLGQDGEVHELCSE